MDKSVDPVVNQEQPSATQASKEAQTAESSAKEAKKKATVVLTDGYLIMPAPRKITEHVYAWIGPHGGPNKDNKGYRMNLAFVVGGEAVTVIETGYTDAMAEEMIKRIKEITPLPIKYVINTNSQPDRMMGNAVFRKHGASIYSTAGEIKRMEELVNNYANITESILGLPLGKATIPEPVVDHVVNDSFDLDLGGGTIVKVFNFHKAGHTPEPLIIQIPGDNIVWGGDTLYSGRLPAVIPGSNVTEWAELFDELRQFGDIMIIPGHGEPAKLSAFETSTFEYVTLLRGHMRKALDDGDELQTAISSLDQSKFSYLENYKELSGRNASWTFLQMEQADFGF